MLEKSEIIAEVIDTKKFSIVFLGSVLGGTYLSLVISEHYHLVTIFLLGLITFAVTPLMLMKRISVLFTRKAKAAFYDNYFSITLLNINDDSVIANQDLSYNDLRSCTINSTQNQYSTIVINLVANKKLKFTFRRIKGDHHKSISESIFKKIKLRKNDILLEPSFFASKKGTTFIIALLFFILGVIVLHIYYSVQTLPYTLLIGGVMFISILVKRKNDIDTFNRLKSL